MISVDKIIFGDNQFFGINHMSQEKAQILSEKFYNLSGVPMLGNTSFNLAGEPLVETLEDALDTIKRSKIKYLYLPQERKLINERDEYRWN